MSRHPVMCVSQMFSHNSQSCKPRIAIGVHIEKYS